MTSNYDLLITDAQVFDGSGASPITQDVAVRGGVIVARGKNLPRDAAKQTVDGFNQWLMPGLLDIHTHFDLELELEPGLPEAVRHGTTTVVIANCSLGLAFGSQRRDGADPIVDCYARVENIPKTVLREAADRVDWDNPKDYLEHLKRIHLGPNVATLFPHSMLRIEVMGFEDSINRAPTDLEIMQMKKRVEEAIDLGYCGLSTDALPFHYLANQPNTEKTIPTQFADYKEIKALTSVLRRENSVWQATPPKDSVLETIKTFLLCTKRLHRKALKTTLVAALDIHNNRKIYRLATLMSRILNSRFLGGRFYAQVLSAPFKVWADGAVTPLAEEIPALRRLNQTDLEDKETRQKLLRDDTYRRQFRAMWMSGKSGFNVARLKRILRLEDYAFDRDMKGMVIDVCPLTIWENLTFDETYQRVQKIAVNKTVEPNATDEERAIIKSHFSQLADEADFVMQILLAFDKDISWHATTANGNKKLLRKMLMNPELLPGFNDSGAHLTNMAFYDGNLRALKIAAEGGLDDVAYMVKRLTRDPARIFNLEAGTMEVGDVADLVLIDPKALATYDGEANIIRQYREVFKHEQLVNRSDGVVSLVVIGGQVAWQNTGYLENFGKKRFGRLLLAKRKKDDSESENQPQKEKVKAAS